MVVVAEAAVEGNPKPEEPQISPARVLVFTDFPAAAWRVTGGNRTGEGRASRWWRWLGANRVAAEEERQLPANFAGFWQTPAGI